MSALAPSVKVFWKTSAKPTVFSPTIGRPEMSIPSNLFLGNGRIYLFGFSRGAYTARATAGVICKFGLLTARGMDGIGYVLDAYGKHQLTDPKVVADLASKYERREGLDKANKWSIPIKFVGVWDTVGSLGIPDLYIFGMRASLFDSVLAKINEKYQFADTNLHPNIEFAFHAYLSPVKHES